MVSCWRLPALVLQPRAGKLKHTKARSTRRHAAVRTRVCVSLVTCTSAHHVAAAASAPTAFASARGSAKPGAPAATAYRLPGPCKGSAAARRSAAPRAPQR
jgi:hypothetical protein